MNKGIKAALALGLCCVTAAGLFGCGKAAPEETFSTSLNAFAKG